MERQFFTVAEVASITGVSKVSLYRAIDRDEIPHFSIGSAIRIPKTWIDSLAQGGEADGGETAF